MRSPQTGPRVGFQGLARPVVALLAVVLLAALLVTAPSPAGADDGTHLDGRGTSTTTAPRLASRGDLAGYDAPKLPPGCFGPARSGIDPFPCPLNAYRPKLPTIVLWGDSHAYEWIPALRQATQGERVNLVSFVAGSCPPVLVLRNRQDGACVRSNYVALKTIDALIRKKARFKVILGSNWSGFRRAYRALYEEQAGGAATGYTAYTKKMVRLAQEGTPRLFDRLARLRVDVDIIDQSATVPTSRPACAAGETPYACDLPRWRALPEETRTTGYLERQQAKILRHGRSRIIDASPGYCTASVCHGKIGGIETYFDDLHLSATRTRALARFFKPAVRALHRKR